MYGLVDGFLGKELLEQKSKYYTEKFPHIYASSMGQDIAFIDIINQYIEKDDDFNFIEVGILAARTGSVLLEEFKDRINYIGIDPLEKYAIGTETVMKEVRELAISRLNNYENATLIMKKSLEVVKTFKDNITDIIFIDGMHDYRSTLLDALNWFPKSKRILAFHDYETYGEVKKAVDDFCFIYDLELKHTFGDVVYIIK